MEGYVLRASIGLNALGAILTWISFAMGAAEGNLFLSSLAAVKGLERMLLTNSFLALLVGSIIWRKQRGTYGNGGGRGLEHAHHRLRVVDATPPQLLVRSGLLASSSGLD